MQRDTPIRFGAALLLSLPFWLPSRAAAQRIGAPRNAPPAAPTQTADQAANVPPAPPPTPAQRPPQRADVTFTQGKLAVTAENSSLNQILREISRQTGIKITGGVADDRVFGKYGPSPASEVLAALLDGTGSNVLLLPSDADSPGELILTPRHGGPTPPNPNAPGFDDDAPAEDTPAPQPQQEPVSQAPPAAAPAQPPAPGAAPQGAAGTPAAIGQPVSTPAASDTSDPNGVKTPEQIFQQLQRMRQQQQPQQ